ncbi:hypothetical protein ACF05W_10855 [Streptomyces lydicus]|uniref:hypothetical protein n=1 Tax=Streptomyces lydicus TaxID=47763 RepID=UPI0028709432|nr:hypothetical protein [Streptomyces lydicus]
MRMVLKAQIPTEAGNDVLRSGSMPKIMETAVAALKPEAAYFTLDGGDRTCFFYFDMQQSSQMPPVLESFFMELHAKVSIQPVMNMDDLRIGLGDLMSGT